MLTFDNVYHAPLDKLKASVDDWSKMTTDLETLASDASSTMAAKAKDDYWRGVNAEVTKPFVDKTAKEFDDAAKAAKGIKQILSDGYQAFKKAKDDLEKLVDTEAPAQHLVITAQGKVAAKHPLEDDKAAMRDPDYGPALQAQKARIEAMQKRVDAIVETCDDADVAVSNALKANITGDKHNFSAPKYSSIDAEEAQRAVDLAKKGRDLSHQELEQLNELLKDNHDSKIFSRNFYDGLGPKGALAFFGQLSTDTYDYSEQDKERLKDVQELQKNLGLNLATATDPTGKDDKWTQKWGDEMRKLGTERIPLAKHDYNGVYGYQLLGGIMRYGNYDPKFLNPIAEHVVQLHAKDPYMFADTKNMLGYDKHPLNPSGKHGAGYDPVISMLEALGHSPEASKEFFSSEPKAYNEDGTYEGGVPKDADGKEITSYLDYFGNKDYKSFPDIVGHDPDAAEESMNYMPDAFGHALESATLGHAYDDPTPKLVRDETTAEIMKEVVTKYGGDAGLLKHQEAMADSLGRMGAGYIDDINWALNDNKTDSMFAPKPGEEHKHAIFGQGDARSFLSTLGQHPDSYASIAAAERIYTNGMLDTQAVGADGKIDSGAARSAVYTGAEVQGMLDQSRADQVTAENMKKDEEYNKALEKRSGWIQFGTGAAIAAGVAFLPATAAAAGAAAILVPLAMDQGSAAAEQLAGQFIGDWSEAAQEEHKDKIEDQIREQRTNIYTAGEDNSQAALNDFMARHQIKPDSDFGMDLKQAADLGYIKGNSKEDQQGQDPETGG
ncbi:hypothetical protein [Streptomyces xantholiticus]|uniref:hypothetical protein n=1 Tax=Streptomyces xantholiticus TaxID=68285 RepID=UPI00167C3313|nr:hypothetical protein [Streptomyces xantholiticus]GGW75326.1 hypothetical protein GCM10010381_69850 [Streptomyces xantholiticus]